MPLRGETHRPPGSGSGAGLGRGGEGGGCVYRQRKEEPGLCGTGECARNRGGSSRRAQLRGSGGGVREASQSWTAATGSSKSVWGKRAMTCQVNAT